MLKQSRHAEKILSVLFACTMLLSGTWSSVYAEDPPAEPTASSEADPSTALEEETIQESAPTVIASPGASAEGTPAATVKQEDEIAQDASGSDNSSAINESQNVSQESVATARAADSDSAISPATISSFKVNYLSGADYISSEDKYYIRPTNNDSGLNSIKFSVTYSISGGTSDHAPGSITMTIPAHLFETRDSAEGNRKYGDQCILPFPSDGYKATVNEQDNTVVITNYQNIDRASVLTFEVQYKLTPNGSILPSDIRDMTESVPFKATMKVEDEDAPMLSAEDTSPVSIIYDTQVNVSDISKSVYQKTDTWPGGNWGTAPEDADQYFYVVYKILTVCNKSTQPFRGVITDNPKDGGEVVSYLDNDHEISTGKRVGMDPAYEKQDQNAWMYSYLGTFASTSTMEPYLIQNQVPQGRLSTTPPEYGLDKPKEASSGLGSYNSCITWVLVRYPKKLVSDGKNHEFKNTATASIHGTDGIDQPKSKIASIIYTYKPLKFTAPRGNTFSLKKGIDGGSHLYGAIDQLEQGRSFSTYDVRKYFTHDAQVNGYNMTLSENGDPQNSNDYGKRQYTVEFIDDLMAFDKDFEHPLAACDFEIDSAVFYLAEKDYLPDETKGEYVATLRTNVEDYPRLDLYGRKGDQKWEKIGTLAGTGFNEYYKAFSFSKIIPEGGTGAKDSHEVLMNKGYTGIMVSYQSNAYSSCLKGTSSYTLFPSQRVKDYIANKDSVELDNVNTLRVLDADGKIQGFYGDGKGFNSEVIQQRDK